MHTTIDPALQEVGLEAMRSALPYSTDPASALVSIDPRNGHIRAMASSSNYAAEPVQPRRPGPPPAGLDLQGLRPDHGDQAGDRPLHDLLHLETARPQPAPLGPLEVHTADEGYQGTINLQQATVTSDNTVFAQLDLDVGPASVAATAKSMGITTHLDGIPAEGIGGLRLGVSPLELTDAYATLASGGIHHNPVSIEQGRLPQRPRRPSRSAADPKRVLSEAVAYEVTRLLHDNITEGTGTAAYTGCAGQAGKTGTTDEYTDAWFSGYQPNLATAVWVGYPQSNEISMTERARDHRLRRHLPGRNLALALLQRRRPLRGIRASPKQPISWAPFYGQFTQSSPRDAAAGGADGGSGEPPPPGSAAVGGYDPDAYDPNAYAPGAGQEPAPLPPPRHRRPAGAGSVGGGELRRRAGS